MPSEVSFAAQYRRNGIQMQAKNAENFTMHNLLIFQQTGIRQLFSPTSGKGCALANGRSVV